MSSSCLLNLPFMLAATWFVSLRFSLTTIKLPLPPLLPHLPLPGELGCRLIAKGWVKNLRLRSFLNERESDRVLSVPPYSEGVDMVVLPKEMALLPPPDGLNVMVGVGWSHTIHRTFSHRNG
jgi:hypothetical protein